MNSRRFRTNCIRCPSKGVPVAYRIGHDQSGGRRSAIFRPGQCPLGVINDDLVAQRNYYHVRCAPFAPLPNCNLRKHAALTERKAFAAHLAPPRRRKWYVYSKRPFGGPEAVLA
jgi:hypothetical protein